jgi:hypothetical protein
MRNIYTLFIIQALLTLLLFFSESYVKYVSIALFCIVDILILMYLLKRTWSYNEIFGFATFFVSLIFLLFYTYSWDVMSMILGLGLMILFFISALLLYSQPMPAPKLPEPMKPVLETYEHEWVPMEEIKEKPRDTSKSEEAKFRARAMAYELEREAQELKRAEKFVRKKELQAKEEELIFEASQLEKADTYLKRETRKTKERELEREVKELQNAEKQIKEVEFLNRQQEMARQAMELAKAQEKIDKATKKATVAKKKLLKTAKRKR